jgi:hypothetical protein
MIKISQKNMKECAKRKRHVSSELHVIYVYISLPPGETQLQLIIIIIIISTIPGNHDIRKLQKTAILGTAHILRKVLM